MARYLLDTNICAFLFRGKYDVDKAIDSVGVTNCAISEITMIELKCGVELALKKSGVDHTEQLNSFLDFIDVIPITGVEDIYASEKVRLRLAGTPLDDNFDLLIACTAILHGMILVTDNYKDFKNIKGLEFENWIKRI